MEMPSLSVVVFTGIFELSLGLTSAIGTTWITSPLYQHGVFRQCFNKIRFSITNSDPWLKLVQVFVVFSILLLCVGNATLVYSVIESNANMTKIGGSILFIAGFAALAGVSTFTLNTIQLADYGSYGRGLFLSVGYGVLSSCVGLYCLLATFNL